MKKLNIETAEKLALQMRGNINASSDEPVNMKTVLRQLNIMTVYRPLSKDVWGLSLRSIDNKMFMLINSNTTRGRQHFTIAHELFHLLFDTNPHPHFCTNNSTTDPTERSANMFASALLMPQKGLLSNIPPKELVDEEVSIDTALRLEQLYGVSHKTFVLRLKELKLISQKNVDKLLAISIRREAYNRGFDRSVYDQGNNGLVIGDYGIMAKKLYDNEKISESHYLELINKIANGESKD